ncbi:RadC family protein [Eubacterium ruminantium]|uniref:RadC family protein n=1 Tax=Eubacterium ruminantium TaxID=42322 RepID=UPI0023EF6F99|nr:DNA repair protein RadC [Eubacterium ruminantium]
MSEKNNLMKISNMDTNERPREKALHKGIESLSDAELLSLILGSGNKDENVIHLAQRVLNTHPVQKGLVGLNYMSYHDLIKISGIGRVKACQVMAVSELSRRISMSKKSRDVNLSSPAEIADYYMEYCRFLTREKVIVIFLSASNELIRWNTLSEGTVNRSLLSPREIFIEALKCDAVNIVLVHNHPSGDPNPSDADIVITKRVIEAGKYLGIGVLDHIIIGDRCYVSLHERGLI